MVQVVGGRARTRTRRNLGNRLGLRAARRSCEDLDGAVRQMDETVRGLGNPDFFITALLARWHAATSTLTWVNCGHPNTYLSTPRGISKR